MKRTKDELLKVISENEGITDEVKVELLEDIADSFTEAPNMDAYVDRAAYEDLKRKYIERFTSGAAKEPEEKKDDAEEKKEITIEDLFTEEKED